MTSLYYINILIIRFRIVFRLQSLDQKFRRQITLKYIKILLKTYYRTIEIN